MDEDQVRLEVFPSAIDIVATHVSSGVRTMVTVGRTGGFQDTTYRVCQEIKHLQLSIDESFRDFERAREFAQRVVMSELEAAVAYHEHQEAWRAKVVQRLGL